MTKFIEKTKTYMVEVSTTLVITVEDTGDIEEMKNEAANTAIQLIKYHPEEYITAKDNVVDIYEDPSNIE